MFGFLTLLFLYLVVVAAVLGWSSLLGWVLTMILPLEFFEGTLLALLASSGAGMVFYAFYKSFELPDDLPPLDFEPDIPSERFFASDKDKTWGNWLRYQFADSIYVEFDSVDVDTGMLDDTELKEIAIRLANVGADVVKRRAGRGRVRSVTAEQIKSQMRQMDLKPYDDDLMLAATRGINGALATILIKRILSDDLWNDRLPEDSLFI